MAAGCADGMALSFLRLLTRPLPLRDAAATTPAAFASVDRNGRATQQDEPAEGAAAARARRSLAGRDRSDAQDARKNPRGVRALRLRAAGDAGDRVHRRARKILARPGSAERGRVLVP